MRILAENLKGRGYLEDYMLDGRSILTLLRKKKCDVVDWIRLALDRYLSHPFTNAARNISSITLTS
jgi:hypothetical protein